MGADPDLMFTDGDVAMAASIRERLPLTVHLLCMWHLGNTTDKHSRRLFPSSRHDKEIIQFIHEFRKLLQHGGKGVMQTSDEYYEER